MLAYLLQNNLNFINYHIIFLFLSLNLILFNTISIYFMKNPIYSLVLLILNYLLAGFLFIYNGLVFIGLIYILLYSGAVSMLLVFTLMLLNIRTIYYKSISINYCYNIYLFVFFICIFFFIIIKKNTNIYYFDEYLYVSWYNKVFLKSDFVDLGYEIFINNINLLLIISLFLTFILVASTSIINNYKISKKQDMFKQLKVNKKKITTN